MGRTIAVLCLLFALVGVALGEQFYIGGVYKHMAAETSAIMAEVETYPDEGTVFDETLKTRIDRLHKFWVGKESKLSVLIRYIDLSAISNALIYAQNFIHSDNKEEALSGLRLLGYLVNSYKTIYGFNGVNIL
jgi:hypothetical protein